VKLSVVVPCFNEEKTLMRCVKRVLDIQGESLELEIIIVDDCSTDRSLEIARVLEAQNPEVRVIHLAKNQGKGAAVSAGFQSATGDVVAVQDADLEYDPQDLRRMLTPLIEDKADVVFGSRFLSTGAHRVLYFWHSLGNYLITSLSNMFTDLNMTDVESGYKVFRREVLRSIRIEEKRFGFEPEIVAKVSHLRPRIFETGISYYGRTYEEGKKIGFRDGLRALYCILKYNAPKAPWFLQLLVYLLAGGTAAAVDLLVFVLFAGSGRGLVPSLSFSFIPAVAVLYLLGARLVFRRNARWSGRAEIILFGVAACMAFVVNLLVTGAFLVYGLPPWGSKLAAFAVALILLFPILRSLVFPEPAVGPWRPQESPYPPPSDPEKPTTAQERGGIVEKNG
jgi:glycosyltransferase involved in cell wall biosynthesis